MEESRRAVVGANPLLFLWGALTWAQVALSYGFSYVTIALHGPDLTIYTHWVWTVGSLAATAYTAYCVYRSNRTPLSGFNDRFLEYVWRGFLLCIAIVAWIAPALDAFQSQHIWSFALSMALISMLFAFVFFVLGGAYRISALKRLGLALWVGTLATLVVPLAWVPLVYGVFVGTGLLLGGFALRGQARLCHDG